jgi:hypothetical protein
VKKQIIKNEDPGERLLFEVAKAFGIIWLIKRLSFLELREWVKQYDDV